MLEKWYQRCAGKRLKANSLKKESKTKKPNPNL